MEQIEALLKVPPDTLALLAIGYLSYRIAFTGKDAGHSTVDVVFLCVVFAFIAKLTTTLLIGKLGMPLAQLGGGLLAMSGAALWRRWLEAVAFNVLRWMKVSAADRHMTAWQSVLARGARNPSQLLVKTKNGTLLMSERLDDFAKAPMGPCVLGVDGSVTMYVTHVMGANGSDWEDRTPFDPAHADWGYTMTYIPASEVAEIRLRCVP